MLQTPFSPGVPIRPPARGVDRFEPGAMLRRLAEPAAAGAASRPEAAPSSRPAPLWREVCWVGFAGEDGPLPAEAVPTQLAMPTPDGATASLAPAGDGFASGEPPQGEAEATRIGPAGTPAVTERPTGSRRAVRRRAAALPSSIGGALLSPLRRARAGFGRLLRIAAVAVTMGVVAVFAYHAGEHLAGVAGVPHSAAAPGPATKAPAALGGPAAYYLDRAKAGDAAAQFNLAALYARGDGVAQDFARAARWFGEAAASGNGAAQFDLAVMYERGLGVAQNSPKAISWYRRAAEHNYVPAQYNLALAYAEGRGVPQDTAAAAHWYHLAASHGSVPAMINLAILYETGNGVERSLADAYAWYRAAARGRDAIAERRADELFRQFAGAEKGKAVLAAAMVVDLINQPLSKQQPEEVALVRDPAAARPVAGAAPISPRPAALAGPAEGGGSGPRFKSGIWTRRGAARPSAVRPRPAG